MKRFCLRENKERIKSSNRKAPFDGQEAQFFCDNNLVSGSYRDGLRVIHPHELTELDNEEYIILLSSKDLVDILCNQLLELKIEMEVQMIPDYVFRMRWNDEQGMPFSIPVDMTKPRLPYLEIQITSNCNLNCRGCIAMCNVKDSQEMTLEKFENNLLRLKELYWGIKYLKLFGGEPLLHKDINKFVNLARKYFPDSDLVVHSNGLLIEKMDDLFFDTVHNLDVELMFTQYPPTGKIKRKIENKLGMKDIRCLFTEPVYEFRRAININGRHDPEEVFRTCSKCINLINGTLSCGIGHVINDLEKEFDIQIYDNKFENCIDIYTTELDGWQINEFLSKAYKLCAYCSFMDYLHTDEKNYYPWTNMGNADIKDWIETD